MTARPVSVVLELPAWAVEWADEWAAAWPTTRSAAVTAAIMLAAHRTDALGDALHQLDDSIEEDM